MHILHIQGFADTKTLSSRALKLKKLHLLSMFKNTAPCPFVQRKLWGWWLHVVKEIVNKDFIHKVNLIMISIWPSMYTYVTSAKKLGSVYYVHNHYIMTIEMLIHEIRFTFFYKFMTQFDCRRKKSVILNVLLAIGLC